MGGKKKSDDTSPNPMFPARERPSCDYYLASGKKCLRNQRPGYTRCSKHPLKEFPANSPPADYSFANIGSLGTIDDLIAFNQLLAEETLADRIKLEKTRAISDLIKSHLILLNEKYKRSPEGQEKTMDEITRMLAIARVMSTEDAQRLLMSRNFGQQMNVEIEILEKKESPDATTVTTTGTTGTELETALDTFQQKCLPGSGGSAASGVDAGDAPSETG